MKNASLLLILNSQEIESERVNASSILNSQENESERVNTFSILNSQENESETALNSQFPRD